MEGFFSKATGPDPGWLPHWDRKSVRAQRSQSLIFSLSIGCGGSNSNDLDGREKKRVILAFCWLGIPGTRLFRLATSLSAAFPQEKCQEGRTRMYFALLRFRIQAEELRSRREGEEGKAGTQVLAMCKRGWTSNLPPCSTLEVIYEMFC